MDDIIKKRKTGQKNWHNPGAKNYVKNNQSQQQFKWNKFPNVKQQPKVVDARQLLQKKTGIADARQKLTAKTVVDARQKLQRKQQEKNFGAASKEQPVTGKIPKVTILNNEYRPGVPKITFHVTQPSKRPTAQTRNARSKPTQSFTSNKGSGIKIAVRNELAISRPRPVPQPRTQPQSPPTNKSFGRLKITTINKDAIKPVPKKMDISPEPRPLRKRTLPESDDEEDESEGMEDAPPVVYRPPRRQQRAEQETPLPVKRSRPDNSTLRPMMSQPRAQKSNPDLDENEDSTLSNVSPIEGTKLQVFNLHPVVSEDDILELFSVLGAVRRARLVKPGEAEVVYIKSDNAFAAYKKYNNRDLDGQPMQIKILSNDTMKPHVQYSWMRDVKSSRKPNEAGEVTELNSGVLQQALFKGGSTGTSTRPVVFTVKI